MDRAIFKNMDKNDAITSHYSVQNIIKSFNAKIESNNELNLLVSTINTCLKGNSSLDTIKSLKNLQPKLPKIFEDAAPLYHEEMSAIITYTKEDLTFDAIYDGVKLLTAIAEINAAIDTKQSLLIWKYLSNDCAHIQNLIKSNMLGYASHLCERSSIKKAEGDLCYFLTYPDIQIIIDEVNEIMSNDAEMISIIHDVNSTLNSESVSELSTILQCKNLNLVNFCVDDAKVYLTHLKELRRLRAVERRDSNAELWLDDVETVYEQIEDLKKESINALHFYKNLNDHLAIKDLRIVCSLLRSPKLDKLHIRVNLIPNLAEELLSTYEMKKNRKLCSPCLNHTLSDGTKICLNLATGKFFWSEDSFVSDSKYVGFDEIQRALSSIHQKFDSFNTFQETIIKLQSVCRGWLVRTGLRRKHLAAVEIQSWWKMIVMQKSYVMYQEALRMWEPQIIKIQRIVRKWLLKRKLNIVVDQLKDKEYLVIKIQKAWRRYKARQNLNCLIQLKNPPISVIRRFIHLLEVSSSDFNEEIRLQKFKTEIVKNIRKSQKLEAQIDDLDVKIGLLVQNIINIEDVFANDKENTNPSLEENEAKNFKKMTKNNEKMSSISTYKGLKALRKESRERLVGYQHLFYLLQTQSQYLSSLIFSVPAGKTTKFLENVIFSLYNYGANDRDNYLLLKLFKFALEKEIRNNVMRLNDIISGNPMVIKMAFSLIRRGPGNSSLRELLSELVNKVISDPSLQVNTNPVEIYKNWVNQLEVQSGVRSDMPYKVTHEAALKYPEVEKRMIKAIRLLKEITIAFCDRIVNNRKLIPYSMQYIGKVLKSCLQSRFPHIPEKDILKTIGHLIYYRYINSAIVSPDSFDIITVSPEKKLTVNQRSNLASIAKVLQLASTKKGFGEDAGYLVGLNSFIIDCHEKFKSFFKACCEVQEPEDFYNIHQYTEATLIIKPTVHLSLQDIVETHQLLLQYKCQLAPEGTDPLHDLLADLDKEPSVCALVGDVSAFDSTANVERTEVCLALSAKVDISENKEEKSDKTNSAKLFLKTKQLLVDLLQCADVEDIHEMASGATSPFEEARYRGIVESRAEQELKAKQNETGLNRTNSFLGEARVSLHEVKTKLMHNLRRLENQALVSRTDNYQTLLNAIAKDIITQRRHRKTRREEIQKLFRTNNKLEEKVNFYTEQLESYKTYLHTCLRNITSRNKNVHEVDKGRNKGIKYTAAKLHEKGVLLEVKDLPTQQLRNVLFEIVPSSTSGVFEVRVKFMGVAMETMQIDVQDLLQLQYEGIAVKQLLGKALINVNLLLHVLNTKFYSKKK